MKFPVATSKRVRRLFKELLQHVRDDGSVVSSSRSCGFQFDGATQVPKWQVFISIQKYVDWVKKLKNKTTKTQKIKHEYTGRTLKHR